MYSIDIEVDVDLARYGCTHTYAYMHACTPLSMYIYIHVCTPAQALHTVASQQPCKYGEAAETNDIEAIDALAGSSIDVGPKAGFRRFHAGTQILDMLGVWGFN